LIFVQIEESLLLDEVQVFVDAYCISFGFWGLETIAFKPKNDGLEGILPSDF